MRNKILKSLYITIFIFFFLFTAEFTLQNIDFLNPIDNALSDFDIFDIYFSTIKKKSNNSEIVIIDISESDRYEIGKILEIINKYSPKVIGIDALFRKIKDPELDEKLAEIFNNTKNLVVVNELGYTDLSKEFHDTIKMSHPIFLKNASQGFANLPNRENKGFRTIRTFYVQKQISDTTIYSFPVEIVKKYNQQIFENLLKRNNDEETINYIGNIDPPVPAFFYLTAQEVLEDLVDLEILKDKIILIGTAIQNPDKKTLSDIFFSPLNEKYAGKTFPDIYGVVIHANIIATIIDGKYITAIDNKINFIITFIITFIVVLFFYQIKINEKLDVFYEGITKISAIIILLLIIFVAFIFLIDFSIKLEINLLFFSLALSSDLLELYLFFEKIIKSRFTKPKFIKF